MGNSYRWRANGTFVAFPFWQDYFQNWFTEEFPLEVMFEKQQISGQLYPYWSAHSHIDKILWISSTQRDEKTFLKLLKGYKAIPSSK